MNDRQNAKLNMAQRVSETFKRYETVYKGIAPVVEAITELNTEIDNIRNTQKEVEAVNVSALTLEKREAEKQMIDPCVKMANALYVIGFTSGNKDLITLQGVSENSLYCLSNNATLALARHILDLTQKYAADLKAYGIDEQEISALDKAVKAYQSLIAKPMDAIGERKQKTSNIAQFFASLDSIFYDRLDKLMVLFKQSAPEFYSEYRTSRNIIFNAERKKKEE